MTKLAYYFTLLYYKMLIKGNYCAIEINNLSCTFQDDSHSH